MGTDTPCSFSLSDVASWLRHQGYGLGRSGYGFSEDGLGSVIISRLKWGKQGPHASSLVQDGYLQVRVDRYGSHVGNPFVGASKHKLTQAYDELLQAVLAVPLSVDDGLREYEGLGQDVMFGKALLSSGEVQLLRGIAERHGVCVHDHLRVRPFAVRAWLVYHASLLVQGTSLELLC